MATTVQPRSQTLPETSITNILTVEIMNDLDDGQPTLLASEQGNQGDLQVVTVDQVLAKVAEQRDRLDRIEALASEYASYIVAQLLEHYGIELIEVSTAKLAEEDPDLAARLGAWRAVRADGTIVIVAPSGQDPVTRLRAVRGLLAHAEVTA